MHVFLTWRTKKLARSLKFEPNCVTNLQTVMSKSINLKVRPHICVSTLITFCQLNTILVRDHEQDAVLMYREAIMIQSQIYGSEHLSVANSLHNLGNCYRDLSDFEKSFDCLSRSLSLLRIFFEDENEEVADTCHCLALTLVRKCELDEASFYFEKSIDNPEEEAWGDCSQRCIFYVQLGCHISNKMCMKYRYEALQRGTQNTEDDGRRQ